MYCLSLKVSRWLHWRPEVVLNQIVSIYLAYLSFVPQSPKYVVLCSSHQSRMSQSHKTSLNFGPLYLHSLAYMSWVQMLQECTSHQQQSVGWNTNGEQQHSSQENETSRTPRSASQQTGAVGTSTWAPVVRTSYTNIQYVDVLLQRIKGEKQSEQLSG